MTQSRLLYDPYPPHQAEHGLLSCRTERGKAAVQIKARFSKREAEEVGRFALWTLAVRSGDGLADLAGRAPSLGRPFYGDRLAMAEYEDAIAEFYLRHSRTYDKTSAFL